MSKIDEGFYNCTASNSEGFVSSTAEIEVIVPESGGRRHRKEPTAPSFIEVLPGKFKVNFMKRLAEEAGIFLSGDSFSSF